MKTEDVKLTRELNEAVWKHGIKNPPHHIKVTVVKDEKGVATADVFGRMEENDKKQSASKKKTEQKEKKTAAKPKTSAKKTNTAAVKEDTEVSE